MSTLKEVLAKLIKKSPNLQSYYDQSYGYAVFPTVGKGGIGIGGAFGKGQVYIRGNVTGDVSLIKATIGFQLGIDERGA